MGSNVRANEISVVAFVGNDDRVSIQAIEQRFGGGHVVIVARRDQEPDRAALAVDASVDFGGEPASASAHATISTLFFTPEAC